MNMRKQTWRATVSAAAIAASAFFPYAAAAEGEAEDVITISGETSTNLTAATLGGKSVVIRNCSLIADCDWSGLSSLDMRSVVETEILDRLDAPNGSYVNTGFNPNQDTRVVFVATVQDKGEAWFAALSRRNNQSSWWNTGVFQFINYPNNGLKSYVGYGNEALELNPGAETGRHTMELDKNVCKLDNVIRHTFTAQTFQLSQPIWLFTRNAGGSSYPHEQQSLPIKFHACQIYDNGTLVRDYVPARRPGVVGLYERVSGAFVINSGSGAFSAGTATGETLVAEEEGGIIDLAGHTLILSTLTGVGTITDSVGGGRLVVRVAGGSTLTNSSIALTGDLSLVKEGAGTFVASKASQTYTGGTVVSNGWAKSAVTPGAFGPARSLITVANGAAFNWGVDGGCAYSFTLEGSGPDGKGALFNSARNSSWNSNYIGDLTLTGDAVATALGKVGNGVDYFGFTYVGGTEQHTLALNGYDLTMYVADRLVFRAVKSVGAGTIRIRPNAGGSGLKEASFYGGACDLGSSTLDIGEGVALSIEVGPTLGTFIDRRTVGGVNDATFVILDRFQPMTTNLLKTVVLGDAEHLSPVLDLSGLNGTFVVPASGYSMGYDSGVTVTVSLGDRTDIKQLAKSASPYLVTWGTGTEPPAEFVLDEAAYKSGYRIKKDVTGLKVYFRKGVVIFVK